MPQANPSVFPRSSESFGKVSYQNLPSVYTLNVLARFAGFEDWTAFKLRETKSKSQEFAGVSAASVTAAPVSLVQAKAETNKFRGLKGMNKKLRWWAFLILPLATLGLSFCQLDENSPTGSCESILIFLFL